MEKLTRAEFAKKYNYQSYNNRDGGGMCMDCDWFSSKQRCSHTDRYHPVEVGTGSGCDKFLRQSDQ